MIKRTEFSRYIKTITNWVQNYFENIEKYPVKSQVKPGDIYNQLPDSAPEESESINQIIEDLDRVIMPGITHWQHPNFHAYFPANSSVESLYAELITASLGTQCMIWETSPAAAELEQRVLEWMRDAMGLPKNFEGVIQDTASSATLVALLTARERATNFQSNVEGVPNNLRIYCSSEAHSSIDKAVGISGIGKKNLIKIEVDEQLRMIPSKLEEQIQNDLREGYRPTFVLAAIGTTGTVAIDPVDEIAKICNKHKIWLHLDAAYAGTALFLPEYQWMIKGIENADSFVFNPHKWMLTNFDCSAYYIKDVPSLTRTFDVLPEYLRTDTRGKVNDYRDWGIALGRRFRALKLWFVLRGYGINGIQATLRQHIQLTSFFVEEISKLKYFKIIVPQVLNFCAIRFQYLESDNVNASNKINEAFLKELNSRGKVYLTHTKINNHYTIRIIIGQTYVEKRHIIELIKELEETAILYAQK